MQRGLLFADHNDKQSPIIDLIVFSYFLAFNTLRELDVKNIKVVLLFDFNKRFMR